jgi:hypothetical protein
MRCSAPDINPEQIFSNPNQKQTNMKTKPGITIILTGLILLPGCKKKTDDLQSVSLFSG